MNLIILALNNTTMLPRYAAALKAAGVRKFELRIANPYPGDPGMSQAFRLLANRIRKAASDDETLLEQLAKYAKASRPLAEYERVILVGFSAAYALAEEILLNPESAEQLDALVWLDSGHSADDRLDPIVWFGERAVDGEKVLFIRHTDVDPVVYPSTGDVAAVIRERLDMPEPVDVIAEEDRAVTRSQLGLCRIDGINLHVSPTKEHSAALTEWGDEFTASAVAALLAGCPDDEAPASEPEPAPASLPRSEPSAGAFDPETPPPAITVRGDRGPAVKAWQLYLQAEAQHRGALDPLPRFGADADHGTETEAATVAWLKARGFARPAGQPLRPRTIKPKPPSADAGKPLRVVPLPAGKYSQAGSYTRGRRYGRFLGIMLHTAETLEHNEGAERLGSWATGKIGVSWRGAVDSDSVVYSVHEDDTSYTCPGLNELYLHFEICGTALQSGDQWDDEFSRSTLEILSAVIADVLRRNPHIPLKRLTAEDLLNPPKGQLVPSGICDHLAGSVAGQLARKRGLKRAPWWRADRRSNQGWAHSTHADVGKGFPWDLVFDCVRRHLAQ